jgi:hypothetical protein
VVVHCAAAEPHAARSAITLTNSIAQAAKQSECDEYETDSLYRRTRSGKVDRYLTTSRDRQEVYILQSTNRDGGRT